MSDRLRGQQDDYCRALADPIRLDVAFYASRYAEALEARVRELEAAVDAVRNLINNSEGVAGLHLNGDVAPWDELMEGGEYEAWLDALAAVNEGEVHE